MTPHKNTRFDEQQMEEYFRNCREMAQREEDTERIARKVARSETETMLIALIVKAILLLGGCVGLGILFAATDDLLEAAQGLGLVVMIVGCMAMIVIAVIPWEKAKKKEYTQDRSWMRC